MLRAFYSMSGTDMIYAATSTDKVHAIAITDLVCVTIRDDNAKALGEALDSLLGSIPKP